MGICYPQKCPHTKKRLTGCQVIKTLVYLPYAQARLSAKKEKAGSHARIPPAHEVARRPQRNQTPPDGGPPSPDDLMHASFYPSATKTGNSRGSALWRAGHG